MTDNNETMQEETVTAVAKTEPKAVQTKETTNWARLHGTWRERIERMLPDAKMIDQFMYAAECSYGANKAAFEKCTPISLLNCLLTSAKYGILPDGRNAHLIPYADECTLSFDYKGLVHVVIRDGVAKKVQAEVVCENDEFEYENNAVTKHVIHLPRGKMLGAYCNITLANGEHQFEIMDLDEIETVKSCSRGSKAPGSPWNKFYKEMAKKSVFRRCTKWIKLSPDVMDAINADNEGFEFDGNTNRISSSVSSPALFPRSEEPKQIEATPTAEPKTMAQKEKERVAVAATAAGKNALPF